MASEDIVASTYGPEQVPSDGALTASSGSEEPAFFIMSDSLSDEQEYSSDSGKGGSESVLTPADSVNETESEEAAVTVELWQMCPQYNTISAYSDSVGRMFPSQLMIYEFEIPQAVVGRLIGRYGIFLQQIKTATGANILVKRSHIGHQIKICAVEGVSAGIDKAISMIRERFPLKKFPNLTLEQTNCTQVQISPSISFLPSNNKINLIEGVVNDVMVSCVVSLEHIFVNQPTHPTYPALAGLHKSLKVLYDDPLAAPKLARPFNPGVICVANLNHTDWYRAEVVAVHEDKSQVTVRLADMGGYVQVSMDALRQIRVDFVSIPFQATECRLANVVPINEEEGWSVDAVNFFKILAQVGGHVLQANVVGYAIKDYVTLVHIYKLTNDHSHLFINEELVKYGYAKWIDDGEYYADYVMSEDLEQHNQLCQDFFCLSTNMPMVGMDLYGSGGAEEVEEGEVDSSGELLVVNKPEDKLGYEEKARSILQEENETVP